MSNTIVRTAVIVTAILGGVLVTAGTLTLSGFIAFDLLHLSGLLGYSLVMLGSGAVGLGVSSYLSDRF